jgi:hypothetical protein
MRTADVPVEITASSCDSYTSIFCMHSAKFVWTLDITQVSGAGGWFSLLSLYVLFYLFLASVLALYVKLTFALYSYSRARDYWIRARMRRCTSRVDYIIQVNKHIWTSQNYFMGNRLRCTMRDDWSSKSQQILSDRDYEQDKDDCYTSLGIQWDILDLG